MGFGLQLLGLGMSGIGMMQQNKRAKEAQALQQYMFREQMGLQRANLGLAQDAFRQNTEENAYRRQIEQLNRLMAQEERQYQINELEKNKQILLEERRAVIERQIKEDKEAAKLAAFRMERLLKNEALSEQERAFAIQAPVRSHYKFKGVRIINSRALALQVQGRRHYNHSVA